MIAYFEKTLSSVAHEKSYTFFKKVLFNKVFNVDIYKVDVILLLLTLLL